MRGQAFIFILAFLYGCVKDKPVPAAPPPVVVQGEGSVLVVSEGNFGQRNGAVGIYDPGSAAISEDVYKAANGETAGDVVQSLAFINGRIYIVVNNSGVIRVCDGGFRKLADIKGLRSPRYMCQVSNRKAYVSDLYANAISVVDLNSNEVTGSIPCRGWSEQMVSLFGKTFVADYTTGYVYVINNQTDRIIDSVLTGAGTSGIVADKEDKLWVIAGDGNRISRVDGASHEVIAAYSLAAGASPFGLAINHTRDTLYYLAGSKSADLYRMAVSGTPPSTPFIAANGKSFYGAGISPSGKVYLSDAIDYSQRSTVIVYNSKGEAESTFKAGVNTSRFYFEGN